MTPNLDELLRSAGEGDPDAWRGVIEACAGRVYAFLARRCGDRELAEELTQAVFVKVVTRIGGYRDMGRFEPWLFQIAINTLRDEMRRRKRQARPMDFAQSQQEALGIDGSQTNPSVSAERAEDHAMLRRAVAELPEPDRVVLELRYTAGLTFAQIAEALEEPLGTVLARGHRALGKLRDRLRDKIGSGV